MASRVNCLRSAAVGKAAGLLIYWQDAAIPLGLPFAAASGACAVLQKSPSKQQYRERQTSLKAA